MTREKSSTLLLVLAEKADVYAGALDDLGIPAKVFADIPTLLEGLPENRCAGLVLDIRKVMRAPRAERDHLLRLVESYPLMRAKLDKSGKRVFFLDDIDCFLHNITENCPRKMRCSQRLDTRLNVLVSGENDPAMLGPAPANILNISDSGCFIHTVEEFAGSRYVHLKVMELTDKRPILGLVRWRRKWGEPNQLPGIGVVFIDIADGQVAEIRASCRQVEGSETA